MTESIGYRSALAISRTIAATPPDGRRTLRVVLGGNGNCDFLKPGIEAALWDVGIRPDVRVTEYDDWIGAAVSGADDADAWIVWLSSVAWSRYSQQRPQPDVIMIRDAIRAIKQRGATVIVVLPEPEPSQSDPFSPFGAWRLSIHASLREALGDDAVLLDPTGMLMEMPVSEWADSRYWIAAKCPWSPDATTRLGFLCGHALLRTASPRVKAVAVDLDDTLWGGVVGEVGVDGVMLDPLGDGAPHLALQRFLKDLAASGTMLAVASKNEPDEAQAVFHRRAEMILRREDFLVFEAHWSSKAESLRRIAERLNIGLEAICFLDNSAHERAEIRQLLPDVMVPDLPDSPAEWLSTLHATRLFLKPVVRSDDLRRVSDYRAEEGRRHQESKALDRTSYLRGLQMRMSAQALTRERLSRAAELVLKTNQFNLTNRRHSEKQLLELIEGDGTYAYQFAIADVFGESGTIGVIVATQQAAAAGAALEIDSFVMSCRVINRGVERAMFAHLVRWARAHAITSIRGRYVPTAKNRLAATFFEDVGLRPLAPLPPDGERLYEGSHLPEPEHFLVVEAEMETGA